MTIIGYARVSTTDQNLELQESRFARRRLRHDPFREAQRHHHGRPGGACRPCWTSSARATC